MENRYRRLALVAAKVGAVGFALAALFYFVVTAQEDARHRIAPETNTAPASETPAPFDDPSAAPAAAEPRTFLFSSKSLQLTPPAAGTQGSEPPSDSPASVEPTFLPTSKSGRLPPRRPDATTLSGQQ